MIKTIEISDASKYAAMPLKINELIAEVNALRNEINTLKANIASTKTTSK